MYSEYGFAGEVLIDERGAPFLRNRAITNVAWSAETRKFYDHNNAQGLEFRDLNILFGAALRERVPVIGQMIHSHRERAARENAEAARSAEQKRLRDIVEGTGLGTWSVDLHTEELWLNERWSTILGYPLAQMLTWDRNAWHAKCEQSDLIRLKSLGRAVLAGTCERVDLEVRIRHQRYSI